MPPRARHSVQFGASIWLGKFPQIFVYNRPWAYETYRANPNCKRHTQKYQKGYSRRLKTFVVVFYWLTILVAVDKCALHGSYLHEWFRLARHVLTS